MYPNQIDLHAVRLCFQVIGTVNKERKCLGTIVSDPIIEPKPNAHPARARIVEQPTDEIFRIHCENASRNRLTPIFGLTSALSDDLTYPAIEVSNYTGIVHVIVSFVSHSKPYR